MLARRRDVPTSDPDVPMWHADGVRQAIRHFCMAGWHARIRFRHVGAADGHGFSQGFC